MCIGYIPRRPIGIPITHDIQEQYAQEVQQAWDLFDKWWKAEEQQAILEQGKQISYSQMPEDIKAAFELIMNTPIPGHPGHTGKESCYLTGVQSMMVR